MTDTATRTGFRYIEADWGDDQHPPLWHLWVDGRHIATAAITDPSHPPFTLTEGLPFRPQWHSAASEEPDSWVYRPPALRRRTDPFWLAMAVVVVLMAASVRWPVLAVAALVAIVAIVATQIRRQ